MGDETTNTDVEEQELLDQADEIANTTADPDVARIIKQLRRENASRRVAANKLASELADAQAQMEELNVKLAETSTNYATLQEQSTSTQERLDSFLADLEQANKAVIESLPEKAQAIVPGGLDAIETRKWLDTAAEFLMGKPTKPPLNGESGQPARGDKTPVVSDAEATIAAKLGLTVEEYAKYRKE